MEYLITLDLGTTSVKTSLFNRNLTAVTSYAEEYSLLTPAPGTYELNPNTYWNACVTGIRRILEKSGISPDEIVSISLSTQGETLIPIDEVGNFLSNAIVWMDMRAEEQASVLKERISSDEFFTETGLGEIGCAIPICKLMWIKDIMPDVYDRTYKFLLLEDYIIYKFTGIMITEPTNMSSTGYFSVRHNRIWLEGLKKAGIDPEKIPRVLPCGSVVGNILKAPAMETGLSPKTIVTLGANDQICGAVGTNNIKVGAISETTGTALAVVSTLDEMPVKNLYNVTISRHCNDKLIMVAYCATSGIVYKWFKDVFCETEINQSFLDNTDVYDRLNKLAEPVARGADGLTVLPFFAGKLSPDYNENARGVFYGLELGHTKGHIARAIMEGVAFMLREIIDATYELSGKTDVVISAGGGAKSPLWNQIKADVLNKEIRIASGQGASLGAAIIGAVSNGWFRSIEEACDASASVSDRYFPSGEAVSDYQMFYEKFLRLYKALLVVFV